MYRRRIHLSRLMQRIRRYWRNSVRMLEWRGAPMAVILLVGMLATASLSTGCDILPEPAPPVPTLVFAPPPTPTPEPYVIHTIERATIEDVVEARGRVAALREAFLFFEIQGWIKDLNVEPGELVSEGDPLASLDAPQSRETGLTDAIIDAEYDLKFKELDLQQSRETPIEENVQRAKAAVKLAEISVQQAQAAYDKIAWQDDVVGRPEAVALQRADVNYQSAQASYLAEIAQKDVQALKIEKLETEVEYAKIALARARTRFAEVSEQTELKAPFSGLIISFDVRIGDSVVPYQSIGAIADPSELRLEASVLEEDMTLVTFGQPVRITLDAYPDEFLAGQITGIASQPTIWQGKNAYDVTIAFDDPAQVPATIRMGADVEILTRSAENVLVVPSEALREEGGRAYVEVMGESGPVRIAVETGMTDGSNTEIVGGLSEGDQILVP